MAGPSFTFILFMALLGAPSQVPQDLLSIVEPDAGLELLGIAPADADLERLIRGGEEKEEAPAATETVDPTIRAAIQNLASRVEKVRERAREDLIAAGPKLLPRMREVAKNDQRRAEEAKKVIEALEAKKAAAKHDELLVRQFAIRLAASRGKKELIPALEEAAGEDQNIFVRLAAEDALARLDSSRKPEVDLSSPRGVDVLAALPANTKAILAVHIGSPTLGAADTPTIGSFMSKLRDAFGGLGGGPSDSDIAEARAEIVNFVRQYGNLRPERAHLVHVGAPTERSGGLGIVVHGLYDRPVLETTLRGSSAWASTETAGFTVYTSPMMRLVPLGDRSVLILPVIASATFPIREYLENLAAKKDVLSKEKDWTGFFAALADDIPVRGLATTDSEFMGELYRELERGLPADSYDAVQGMKTLSAMIAPAEEKKIRVRLEATFAKDGQAEVLATFIRQGIDMVIAEIKSEIEGLPVPALQNMARRVLAILEAITVTGEGKTGVLRFTTEEIDVLDLLMVGGVPVR